MLLHLLKKSPADPTAIAAGVDDLVPEHIVVNAFLYPIFCRAIIRGSAVRLTGIDASVVTALISGDQDIVELRRTHLLAQRHLTDDRGSEIWPKAQVDVFVDVGDARNGSV